MAKRDIIVLSQDLIERALNDYIQTCSDIELASLTQYVFGGKVSIVEGNCELEIDETYKGAFGEFGTD